MILDDWQDEFIKTKGDKILCCGRQVGKTEICAKDCGDYVQHPDNPFPVLMTAPTERQARILFDKTLNYLLENYPKSVVTKGRNRPTNSKITLKNGMIIYCLPTGQTGVGIRGLTIGRSYEDENAQVPEEIEQAIAPMLATTGGSRIKLSTPHGCVGEFYRTWINKDGAYDSYTRFSVTSETVLRNRPLSDTWTESRRDSMLRNIEQAKLRMSKHQFAQEYLGEFIEDLHKYFSTELINSICTLKRPESLSARPNYFLGVDIARMGEDRSAYCVMMRTTDMLIQVDQLTTEKTLTTDNEKKILALVKQYNVSRVYIDAGSGTLGVSIFDHLFPILKEKIIAINNAERVIEYNPKGEPFTTKLKKVDLYDNLRALMEQGRIRLLDDDEIRFELESIQYEYVQREGYPTQLRIFANPSPDIVESITRAAWCVKEKINKFNILYI